MTTPKRRKSLADVIRVPGQRQSANTNREQAIDQLTSEHCRRHNIPPLAGAIRIGGRNTVRGAAVREYAEELR